MLATLPNDQRSSAIGYRLSAIRMGTTSLSLFLFLLIGYWNHISAQPADPFCFLGEVSVDCYDIHGNPTGKCVEPCCDWIDTVKYVKGYCLPSAGGGLSNNGNYGDGDVCHNDVEGCKTWSFVIRNKWQGKIKRIVLCSYYNENCCQEKPITPLDTCQVISQDPNHICDLCCPFTTSGAGNWVEHDSCRKILGGNCGSDTLADGYCDSLCRSNCLIVRPAFPGNELDPNECIELKVGFTGAQTKKCIRICVYFGQLNISGHDSVHCCDITLPASGVPPNKNPALVPCNPPQLSGSSNLSFNSINPHSIRVDKGAITFESTSSISGHYEIYDSSGKVRSTASQNLFKGTNTVKIHESDISDGPHGLKFVSSTGKEFIVAGFQLNHNNGGK
ncbi:MAG: hypothetical protein IT211_01120 [Armatimonadetes bacterium]|nr:hypothetical protein [Armatimonadota bacterium]